MVLRFGGGGVGGWGGGAFNYTLGALKKIPNRTVRNIRRTNRFRGVKNDFAKSRLFISSEIISILM